jgi:hypothetical protein
MSLYAGLLLGLSFVPFPALLDGGRVVRHAKDDYTIHCRDFLLPFNWEEGRKDQIKSVILSVSTDRGRTWGRAGEATADVEGLPFHAKEDGDYWFTLQVVGKDGTTAPAEAGGDGAQVVKVRVDTRGAATSAKAPDPMTCKMPYAD